MDQIAALIAATLRRKEDIEMQRQQIADLSRQWQAPKVWGTAPMRI